MTVEHIGTESKRVVLLTPASQVAVERQAFVKQDWYPLDVVTLVAGRAGEGKSTLVLSDAAQATLGSLPGEYEGQQLTVAVTATEDTKSMQRARLEAAGADLNRVLFLDVANMVAGESLEAVPRIPEDLPGIRQTLIDSGAVLWIIDPITALVGGDTNRRDDVRAALDPLHALARELHISVVGILHFGKGAGYASDKISGSHAFRDVARSVLLVAHDDDTGEHVVTLDKSNYSQAAGTSWSFQLVDTPVPSTDGTVQHVPRVTGMTETDLDVGTIINREITTPGDDDDRTEAERWLTDYLQSAGGSAAAKAIITAAVSDGFSKATIQRAGKKLCEKSSGGFQQPWTWTVKEGSHQGSQGSRSPERENDENDGANLADPVTLLSPVCPDHNVSLIDGQCPECARTAEGRAA